MADDETILCHRCGVELTPGISNLYAVRIEAVADPFDQRIAGGGTAGDIRAEIEDLIADMSEMSQRELMDQVVRRMTLILCGRCYRQWIENPTG
jgi:hypothetical protein